MTLILVATTSCASRKDVVYLQDASMGSLSQYNVPVLRIAKGDMLGITAHIPVSSATHLQM